jgi:ABC-type dipeptide/oligopeptide/nickel transport system permease subunit
MIGEIARSAERKTWFPAFLTKVARIVVHPSGLVGILLLIPIVALVIVNSGLIKWDPNALNMDALLEHPSAIHLMGTDQMGRDQLARIGHAIPLNTAIPLGAVAIALAIGGGIGVLAGYLGGFWERILMWVTDIFLAMPELLLAVFIIGVFGVSLTNTMIAIAVIFAPRFSRIARGSTLKIKHQPYVDAARIAGTGPVKLIFKHIIPGIFPELLVMATLSLSDALITQSALSFLGLGLVPPHADLGVMLSASIPFVNLAPWLMWFPALTIICMILGFNLIGDAVRDVVDPRVSRARYAASKGHIASAK